MSAPLKPDIWQKKLNPAEREIRLLLLEPGDDGALNGRLVSASLNHHPGYTAISRAWGGPRGSSPIRIGNVRFPLTQSLFLCLRYLRRKDHEQALWIDVISVNQFDLEERSQQVQLMQSIFSDAICVYVWLGYENPSVHSALQDICHIAEGIRASSSGNKDKNHRAMLKSMGETALANLSSFTHPEWWSRLWPLQEVVLARSLIFQFKDTLLDMIDLKRFVKFYNLEFQKLVWWARDFDPASLSRPHYHLSLKKLTNLILMSELLQNALSMSPKDKMRKLLLVLNYSRCAKVSDQREHVYGLLGITTALFGTDFMHPDYAFTAATVFSQFALALIKASGSLLILGQVSAYQNTLTNLPSFAPDWTSFYDFLPETRRLWTWDFYRASGSLSLALRAINDQEISVAYHTFTVVKHTSPPNFAALTVESMIRYVQQYLHQLFKHYLEWSELSRTSDNGPPFRVSDSTFAMTMFRGVNGTGRCKFQAPSEAASELKIVRDNEGGGKASKHVLWLGLAKENSCFFVTSDGDPAPVMETRHLDL
jgi:Heterokaryon incompatibility protein (HET)